MKTFNYTTHSKQVLGDMHTPVSIYLKVRDMYPQSALMESSDYHAGENSLSFIALCPLASIGINGGIVTSNYPDNSRTEEPLTKTFHVEKAMNRFINQFSKMHSSDSTVGKMLASIVEEASDFVQNWMKTDLMEKVNLWMTQLTVGMIQMIREVFNFIIGIIVSIYVLFSKEKFQKQTKKLIYAVFRPGQANMILQIGGKSNEIFGGFIIGKIIDSLIIGVICFIGLSILNMPYTMLVSVIVGVTNVIPFFGPYIGAIPSAILILLADPLKGLYFIIFVIALQQFDGNVLGPKILGNSTGLSSFWVVFSILIAGGLFGIPGMLFGVPAFAVIYYIVNMLVNSILKKKELPTDTECYGKNGYVDSEGIYIQKEKQEEIKEIQEEKGDKDNADSSTK